MPVEAVPDLATAVAAMVLRYSYTFVAAHQAGHDELPGTMPHQAVIAWRAAAMMAELMTAASEV